MPSASAKLEKQASSNPAESTDNNNGNTPIRQALVIIEHKIRNLEKRKTKLETYRAIQSSGKELSSDQKTAVSKYDEVAQSLEFARELSKQIAQLATMADKEQRKQARKEAVVRAQSETAKIREVLTIQNILSQFENSVVREDFLNGTNGAVKLEESDLQVLEKFYIDIQVTRQNFPEDTPFSVSTQKAAEYLSLTIDGRPKSYGDTTFENIRRILQSIQECGYLDKGGKIDGAEEYQDDPESDQATTENDDKLQTDLNLTPNEQTNETGGDIVNPNIQSQQQQILSSVQGNLGQNLPKFSTEAPSAAAVPAPAFPQQPQPAQSSLVNTQIQAQPPQLQRQVVPGSIAASVAQVPAGTVGPSPTNPLHAAHFPPTTVRAVEQAYFKQHQYIQQMRPLAEVIGTGNFYFLQDSELDSPDLVPSGFTPNETQNPAPNIAAGNLPPQSPNSVPPLQGQNVLAQQQQPQMPPQPNSSIQAQKAQQQPTAAPIPTQTFTNQSFPPIVPPTAIFPQDISTSPSQIPVFAATPMPLPQLVAQPAAVIVPQTVPVTLTCVDGQQAIQQNSVLTQPNQNPQNLITGPSGANVPLPGFSSTAKFQGNPPLGIHQVNTQMPPIADQYDQIQPPSQVVTNESGVQNHADEVKDRTQDATNEWDAHESSQTASGLATSNAKEVLESNQWSNEVAATTKNDWNSFDNQNESNTWNSNQNDSYGNRSNRNYGGNRANSGGGSGGGGTRGIRGGNTGSSSSNGYRGRSNNSYQQQQQQNGRNNVYFRNNDNGYYQNQNGGYNAGNKQDSGNSYGNNANNSSYRGRSGGGGPGGGSMSQGPRPQTGGTSNRSGPPNSGSGGRNNSNNLNSNRSNVGMSNPGNRPGRNNGNSAGTYGSSSRPPNTVRQQQDVNA